jgi:hypothetical protein
MYGIDKGTYKSPNGKGLHAHFTVAHSPQAVSDYLASLKRTDFKGWNPATERWDTKWAGRKDLGGKTLTNLEGAALLGDYVEDDHKQIANASKRMSDLVDSIDVSEFKRRLTWSDSRGRVNATRLLNGDSTFRRTIRKSSAPVEAVALVIPTMGNCNIKPEILFAKTAVALAASEILSEAGFTVEVWAYAYSEGCLRSAVNGTKNCIAAVQLKAGDEPLNEAIAASGGSSWFFRSGMFAMWATHGDAASHLGSARDLNKTEGADVCNIIGLDKAHVMRKATSGTVEQAIKDGIEDVIQAITAWTEATEE